MPTFTMVHTDAEGIRGESIVATNRVRVMRFGDERIRVNPKKMIIEVLDADGGVTKTLSIDSVPDHREFHKSTLSHLVDTNPQVEVDITE